MANDVPSSEMSKNPSPFSMLQSDVSVKINIEGKNGRNGALQCHKMIIFSLRTVG